MISCSSLGGSCAWPLQCREIPRATLVPGVEVRQCRGCLCTPGCKRSQCCESGSGVGSRSGPIRKLFAGSGSEAFFRIRIRSFLPDPDPKLFVGSGVRSGMNNFGSRSEQPLSGMNLKQNYSDKIRKFSTKCTFK